MKVTTTAVVSISSDYWQPQSASSTATAQFECVNQSGQAIGYLNMTLQTHLADSTRQIRHIQPGANPQVQ
jgi:hypothetical protein